MRERLLEIVTRFSGTRVAILGDFVADVFVFGAPSRLSREAPVPILRYEGERVVPGSAGNVACNVMALGGQAVCIGSVGRDAMGERLRHELAEAGADVSALLMQNDLPTCTKMRIMAGDRHRAKQQVVRIDREPGGVLLEATRAALLRETESRLADVRALIISDYGGGTVLPAMIERAGTWAGELFVIADSRYRLDQFKGIAAATPNEEEFETCIGRSIEDDEEREKAGEELRRRLGMRALLITRGNQGMMLCREEGPMQIPIVGSDDVTDVTGAGDTVVSLFALSLACGAGFPEAARLANHAAGVVVMKAGTASCSVKELQESVQREAGDSGDPN